MELERYLVAGRAQDHFHCPAASPHLLEIAAQEQKTIISQQTNLGMSKSLQETHGWRVGRSTAVVIKLRFKATSVTSSDTLLYFRHGIHYDICCSNELPGTCM